MKSLMSLLAISLISTNVGCALCSSCDDYSYAAFGGLWERSDMTYGRVGSAFSPHGYAASDGESVHAEQEELAAPEPETLEAPLSEPDVAPEPAAESDPADSSLET